MKLNKMKKNGTKKTGESTSTMSISIGRIVKRIAVVSAVVGLFTGAAICAPSQTVTRIDERAKSLNTETRETKSVVSSVRTLMATAWCLINEAPVNNLAGENNSRAIADFLSRRNRILTTMKGAIKKKKIPSIKELEALNELILKLYDIALKSEVFDKRSVDMVLFTGNMTVAQGYIDCALFMARGSRKVALD